MTGPALSPLCPIMPRGRFAHGIVFVDRHDQLQVVNLGTTTLTRALLLFWFGQDWLDASFPQWERPANPGEPARLTGFDHMQATRWLIETCCAAGEFHLVAGGRV